MVTGVQGLDFMDDWSPSFNKDNYEIYFVDSVITAFAGKSSE